LPSRIQQLKINADPDPPPCDKESKSSSKLISRQYQFYAVRKTLANIVRFLLRQDALPSPSYTIPPAQLLCQLVTSSSSEPISADNQLYLLLPPAPEVNEPELTASSAHTPHHAAHTHLVASSLLERMLQSFDFCTNKLFQIQPVLRVRDVYPGSRILIFTHP